MHSISKKSLLAAMTIAVLGATLTAPLAQANVANIAGKPFVSSNEGGHDGECEKDEHGKCKEHH